MARKSSVYARWTAGEVAVSTWFERDRAFVRIQERATGEYLAEWWDEDAVQMFEDGFFERGKKFERSVIDYADSFGISPYPRRSRRRR